MLDRRDEDGEGAAPRTVGPARAMRCAALLALVVGLALVRGAAGAEPVPAGDVGRGRALYRVHCARCHGEEARGDGPDGALLESRPANLRDGVLGELSDDQLVRRIREGRVRFARLPKMPEMTPRTDALASFVRRMPKLRWPSIDSGRAVYLGRCAHCHGRYGHGDGFAHDESSQLRDLADPAVQRSLDTAELAVRARHAKAGMPPLDPPIAEREARDVVAFVRVLSPGYELYARYCVACHGPHGRAGEGEPGRKPWLVFDERYFRTLAPGELKERIWHMLRGVNPPMPHFESVLGRRDVMAIVGYLRSLPAEPAR